MCEVKYMYMKVKMVQLSRTRPYIQCSSHDSQIVLESDRLEPNSVLAVTRTRNSALSSMDVALTTISRMSGLTLADERRRTSAVVKIEAV